MSNTLPAMLGRSATISPCKLYRYTLARWWVEHPKRVALWVMLNPSTADDEIDDRTIGRCIGFSKSWGLDGLIVGNLYALRSTDPKALASAADPVGPGNDKALYDAATLADVIVCGWGSCGFVSDERVREVLRIIGKPVHCLGVTASGMPAHPLYLPGDTLLREYNEFEGS